MKLIETTAPLYLRRLVRAVNATPAAYVDGSIVNREHNPRRNGRASLLPGRKHHPLFCGSVPQGNV